MKKGFTLAEVLVVIGVLSVVGIIVLTIFTRTLRGNNKSQILTAIKENGQSVLENLDKSVRNADNIVCAAGFTMVIFKDGAYTRYRFVSSSAFSNGSIQQDIASPSAEESDPRLFVNRVCNPADPMNGTSLTDTNPQTGVSLSSGSFTLNKGVGYKDTVTINFVLKPGFGAFQAVAGQIDPITFQTTTQLR